MNAQPKAETDTPILAVIDAAKPVNPIAEAMQKTREGDAGALFEKPVLDLLTKLRASDPAKWARVRNEAKETKRVSLTDLDRLTASGSAEGGNAMFDDPEPWPDDVDGAALLDDITAIAKRHVIADPPTLRAAVLWIAFTWLIDVAGVAPIANITAPGKRCGKTILLSLFGKLAYRPMQTSSIAPAALFRSIEAWSPTLLIDEVDTFLQNNEEARGILNSGFTRDSAFVIRCVGDDHTPTKFATWGAKALCGIGKLADTLADRSIPLRMRRKKAGERVDNLRHADSAEWDALRSRLARWADDHREEIRRSRPALIGGLNDRANDCWEPLQAIAQAAGGQWPAWARADALALHGAEEETQSIGEELLADIRDAFTSKGIDRIASVSLLEALNADEESPWPTWNRGKPMNARQLSKRLDEFGIRVGPIRVGGKVQKGYYLTSFADAFDRYLTPTEASFSPDTPQKSVTRLQPNNGAASSHFRIGYTGSDVTDTNPPEMASQSHCNRVTDKNPPPGEKKGKTDAEPGSRAVVRYRRNGSNAVCMGRENEPREAVIAGLRDRWPDTEILP